MILIPKPAAVSMKSGVFRMDSDTLILLDAACGYGDFRAAAELKEEILKRTGVNVSITKGILKGRNNAITLMKAGLADSYSLAVDEGGVKITGRDGEGLFDGIQTMRQLVRNYAAAIPCLEIRDRPQFKNRGFYHDITRGKVPTLETLMELADRLSFYKLNQLQLYIEHSFAFRGHSEIWLDSDPVTAEEILRLDEYCKRRHVELVPSLSTFGHLFHALTSESFRHLNEFETLPDNPFMWTERMSHYTLDALNPESIDFVRSMLDEFMPLFTSDKFNICCDETFDLGNGRNREAVQNIGRSALYLDFVKKIAAYVRGHGRTVMMWGDILLKYPEAVKEVPKDIIILNWDYEPGASIEGVRLIAETGLRQYVCPGVQGWNRLVNDMASATENIKAMVSHGISCKAEGVLNTDWGDFGHVNLLANSMPGAIYGAGLSWNAEDTGRPSDREISVLEYGDRTGRLIGLLREISMQRAVDWFVIVLWYYHQKGLDTGVYSYESRLLPLILSSREEDITKAFHRILELKNEIYGLHMQVYEDRKQDLSEFVLSAEGLALMHALLLCIKKYFLGQEVKPVFEPRPLAEKLEYWMEGYKKLWRMRNKESELYRIREIITGVCKMLRQAPQRQA
jgi:hypothetical protein